jgi:vitamin B12 transporter
MSARRGKLTRIALLVIAEGLSAQDQKSQLIIQSTKTVVTVTARPTAVETSAADVSVIAPEDTPAASPDSLAELLRFQPALYVGQTGQRGGLTALSLRGGDANFTLVMIDGIPVNDVTDQLGGTVDLGAILPFHVGRVEVVRGPMSAVYGSEAVAGVVNMITRDEPAEHWTLTLEGGSFGTFEGRIGVGGRRGRVVYNLGVAGVRVGEQVERDSFDAIDSGGRIGVALSPLSWLTFSVRLRHAEGTGFPANSGGPRYAIDRDLETRASTSGLAGVEWKRATDRWSHMMQFDLFRQGQDQNTPVIFDTVPPSFQTIPATISRTSFQRARVNASSSARLMGSWTGTIGVAYRRESGENLGLIAGLGSANYQLDRNLAALFAETIMEHKLWSVVAGLRSDWVSGGVHRLNPRLGGSVAPPWRGARLRASWGRGFKMPSFYALAQPFIGNPQLQPETSTAVDAGLEQRVGRRFGTISANVFRSAYSGLIDFSPELFRLVNRSEAIARGVDFSWRLVPRAGFAIQAHATYTSVHLKTSSEPLRDRPRWRTGAMLSIPVGARTSLYAEGLFVASRFDFQLPVPQMDRAPSYFVANAGARHRIHDNLAAFLRIDNVLDRHFEEYVGFPNPGIQVRAGFDWTLR